MWAVLKRTYRDADDPDPGLDVLVFKNEAQADDFIDRQPLNPLIQWYMQRAEDMTAWETRG